eukprot:Sdes_comp17882_c0_seq1m7144
MVCLTSAAGILALLDEPQPEIKAFALEKLNVLVDTFWAEISDAIGKIEIFYEDEKFPQRKLASLIASKVYYHLGEFEDSLQFALGAGDLFDVTVRSQYVDTMIAKCIDKYTQARINNYDSPNSASVLDARLVSIVNRMFARCFADKEYRQAVGISLETRRLDIFEKAVKESDHVADMLTYAMQVCMTLVQCKPFRTQVLTILADLYKTFQIPDFINMSQCFIFLNDYEKLANLLISLCENEQNLLIAFQISFDTFQNATQHFLSSLRASLTKIRIASGEKSLQLEGADEDGKSTNSTLGENLQQVDRILSGEITITLYQEFLFRNMQVDMYMLTNTKNLVQRNSVCHTAVVIANSFLHTGTTIDSFLRDNLDWLGRATNWSKFGATASLGVIHKGHIGSGQKILQMYLPQPGVNGSVYSEGGSLYAFGLIHANHGAGVVKYLMNQLKSATSEVVQHGACLGIGVADMASSNLATFEELKGILYTDNAVSGEAAALAMGLVMLGTGEKKLIAEMVQYARDTQHEKIIRGIAFGVALILYGKESEADEVIDPLVTDQDPILRLSAVYCIAMAYCGTGNNCAIKKLLHVAVSDVNNDVRRGAVISLGFLFLHAPDQCPNCVSLLSESYNAHVRYGAALALGIACAGTGNLKAIDLLEPLTDDSVDYVRQGALIGLAMVCMNQSEAQCPAVKSIRQKFEKAIANKHEDTMTKFGAILSQGIIDAGGRNMTICPYSRGHTNMSSVVGLLLFTQFWYWYPLSYFLSLAFTPLAVIGLNRKLQMPKVQFRSDCKPSLFAYPPMSEPPKEVNKEKVTTAVLSVSSRTKPSAAGKRGEEPDKKVDAMVVDGSSAPAVPAAEEAKVNASKQTAGGCEEKVERRKSGRDTADFSLLDNPCRVAVEQIKYISFPEASRYVPVKSGFFCGITLLKDATPEEEEELVELSAPKSAVDPAGASVEDEDEPSAPEPF